MSIPDAASAGGDQSEAVAGAARCADPAGGWTGRDRGRGLWPHRSSAHPGAGLARLRQALAEITSDKAVADHFGALGIELTPLIGDAYRDFIVKDLEQWRGVAKAANVRIEN